MRALIVEDQSYKANEAIQILSKYGIDDITIAPSVMEALKNIKSDISDIMIADLGLPLRKDEMVNDPKEGYTMLRQLSYMRVHIPTIIYSTTQLEASELDDLKEDGYPLLGHAKSSKELNDMISSFIEIKDKDTPIIK